MDQFLSFALQHGYIDQVGKAVPSGTATLDFAAFWVHPTRGLGRSSESAFSAVSAIKNLRVRLGLPTFTDSFEKRLKAAIKGGASLQGPNVRAHRTRVPLLPSNLVGLLERHAHQLEDNIRLTFATVVLAASVTLARVGNILPNSVGAFDPRLHVTRADVSLVDDSHFEMVLSRTKTRPQGQLTTITAPRSASSSWHPFTVLSRYHALRTASPGQPSSPYFVKAGSVIFTKQDAMKALRSLVALEGLNPAHFGLHSLRQGGATALAASGAADCEIQNTGDWTSNAHAIYTRHMPLARRSALQGSMLDVPDVAAPSTRRK